MRTKTPKQIHEQQERIFALICGSGRTPINIDRLTKTRDIVLRYWDNIYKAYGIADHQKSEDIARCNWIWANAAAPISIYAKQV